MTDDPARPSGVSAAPPCAADDLLTRVALLLPAAPAPTDAAVTAARARLAAAPVTEHSDRRLHLPRLSSPRSRRRPLVVNTALAVVVVAVTLALVSGAVGSPPPAEAGARAALLQAGASAGRATPLTPRRDQLVHVTTHSTGFSDLWLGFGLMAPDMTPLPDDCTFQEWDPVDPTATGGRATTCRSHPTTDGQTIRPIPPVDQRTVLPELFPTEPWDQLQALVGPPSKAYDALAARARADQRMSTPVPLSPQELHERILREVGRLMGQGGPQVDSVLYQVAAMLPGVELVDGLVDVDGRSGTGVSITTGSRSTDLVFDPSTGQALGGRTLDRHGDRGHPAGATYAWSTTTRVVDAIG